MRLLLLLLSLKKKKKVYKNIYKKYNNIISIHINLPFSP